MIDDLSHILYEQEQLRNIGAIKKFLHRLYTYQNDSDRHSAGYIAPYTLTTVKSTLTAPTKTILGTSAKCHGEL